MNNDLHTIEVWGELACFTRPELKVERYSYPIITPSSARGIFDSIYWKPGFYWRIKEIEILNPIRYIALKRNEVKDKAPSDRTISSWMKGTKEPEPIFADGTGGSDFKGRTQRQTMALKNVRYRITANIVTKDVTRLPQINAQFIRRANSGKCFQRPYLGCREFTAFFKLVEEKDSVSQPMKVDIEVGWMIYDLFKLSTSAPDLKRMFSTFWADIKQGKLSVPEFESPDVKKEILNEDTK